MAHLLKRGRFYEMTAGDGTEAYCILGASYEDVQVTLRGDVYGSAGSGVGILAAGRGAAIDSESDLAELEAFTEWDDMNDAGDVDDKHSTTLGPEGARYAAVKLTGLSAGVGVVVY